MMLRPSPLLTGRVRSGIAQPDGGEEVASAMADQFKCLKCGKTSPKFANCCGGPMKKVA